MELNTILHGHCLDVLKTLPDHSVNTVITSPPYWGLRDYGVDEQIGLESSVDEYVLALKNVFHEVKRVLKDDGTLWLNLGDAYAGSGRGRNADGKGNP
ncbi:DNA methyltransferase, partial [Heyndrickxia oleronia]|uniref:DNA methyltransferase n=1 Tax=Heyndrickxia oleronia TaxID=38875 RepID=UPI001C0ED8E2